MKNRAWRCSGPGLALVLQFLVPPSRALACVVGTGTTASCNESALKKCLPGGASFNGNVTFHCGGNATISAVTTKYILTSTTIDGGDLITISGGPFRVSLGAQLTLQNIAFENTPFISSGALAATNCTFSANSPITSSSTLTVTDCDFVDNETSAILNSGTATVDHCTFSRNTSGGQSSATGGAIFNVGTLAVTNSTFDDNKRTAGSGGAIYNQGGTLTVADSTIINNSGGIFNGGYRASTTVVTNSRFAGNDDSGIMSWGIDADATLTVIDSTFSGNVTGGSGGGIYKTTGTLTVIGSTFSANSAYDGGGIANGPGLLTLANSTFTGNVAGNVNFPGNGSGGGLNNYGGGVSIVTNSSFSGNAAPSGGGIANQSTDPGTVVVTNVIVANSTMGGNCSGSIEDGGHNIDTGTMCGFTGAGCTATAGTSFCNTGAGLDPAGLQDNGGPTQTIALCTGPGIPSAGCTGQSPAINAGDDSVCSTTPVDNLDQRGFVRPGTGAASCSIGAFEANLSPAMRCGDVNDSGSVTAGDALAILKAAVGGDNCAAEPCLCDTNNSGSITASDALAALKTAVGQGMVLTCPCPQV